MKDIETKERENSQLVPFTFGYHTVRTVLIDGEPWFVAKDVCEVLGIQEARSSLRDFPEDEKGVHNIHTLGGKQKMLVVNEPGLYRLIFQSRKPEAELFKTWVFTEVLPCIRRTGSYRLDTGRNPSLDGPFIREMLDVIKRNTEAVESLQSELHSQRQAITRHIPSLSSSLPPEKEEWIETTELCSIYGKSRATVLAHARALGWDMRVAQAKTSGSLTFEYRVSCLPEKLRQAWAEKNVGEIKEPTSAGQQESLFTPEGEVK